MGWDGVGLVEQPQTTGAGSRAEWVCQGGKGCVYEGALDTATATWQQVFRQLS